PIKERWRFRTGDDAAYRAREFDEAAWETIPVPQRWSEAGHRDYTGVAWYRTRFSLPPVAPGRPPYLELGKIADADEAFVNGVKVGQTGDFPPAERDAAQAYRRYRVPSETLNWGGDNVLAVRVFGGAGAGGGLWSVRRDMPPHARSPRGRRISTVARTRSPSPCRRGCGPGRARRTCPAPCAGSSPGMR